MKWFQQNRAFGTLLIVFGICALLAVALLYWRWTAWNDARQAFDQVAAERNRLGHLDPFPNDANYRKLQGYLETYTSAVDKFKEALKAEVAPAPSLAPNEFQSRLRQATIATLGRARVNNVKLPDKFQLGFDEFATIMPNTAVTPLLGQELSQIQMLINILLDAKVDSVTSLRRPRLPEERGAAPTPTPSPSPGRRVATAKLGGTPVPTLIERNIVDVTFKAAPSAARKVLNEIVSSTGQFFIVRTLYVHNEKDKGPSRERAAGSAPAESAQATGAQPAAAGSLNFIVGNEHIEVSATIEMLRFAF
ncbi:MAG: hypothetical protein DME95_01795 [Verrucomicrobia bacterium]|nr:MAG: hypothetical protein DME95_01795 [Verrucomicrobiota bacterium]